MRVRTTQPDPAAFNPYTQWLHCQSSDEAPVPTDTVYCTPSFSQITDEGHSGWVKCGRLRSSRMTSVDHAKWRVVPNTSSLTFSIYPVGTIPGLPEECTKLFISNVALLGTQLGGMSDQSFAWVPYLIGSLTYSDPSSHWQRWLRAKPSMSSRANLAVFLYELRDIKRMFDLIPRKHFSLGSWRDVLRYGNSQHLNWNFGWKPFLGDIKSTLSGLSSFETRLRRFISDEDKQLLRHERDPVVESDGDTGWVNTPHPGYQIRKSWKCKVKYTSTFSFSYSIPPYDWEELRFRAFLDTLGLQITPRNIWAVLPWSFVCDWFADVGSYLDRYSSDWIEPWINFCQACTSVKVQAEADIRGAYAVTVGGGGRWEFNLASVSYSHYVRTPGIPTACVGSGGELSADKIRLLASLMYTLI